MKGRQPVHRLGCLAKRAADRLGAHASAEMGGRIFRPVTAVRSRDARKIARWRRIADSVHRAHRGFSFDRERALASHSLTRLSSTTTICLPSSPVSTNGGTHGREEEGQEAKDQEEDCQEAQT